MKLSKRERVLIIILLIALSVYAAYKFIPTSQIFNLESLQAEYNLKNVEYNNMSQNILLKTKHAETVQTLTEEINNLDVISDIQQEQLIVFLNNYFASNNIDANNISFTDAVVVPNIVTPSEPNENSSLEALMMDIDGIVSETDTIAVSEQATQQNASVVQASMTARQISVNVAFESTYNDMLKFIDAIQNNPVDISITNMNTVAPGGDILQGTMILNFYEVPKPEGFTENNKEWVWEDLVTAGKSNPFAADGGAFYSYSGSGFDFYLSVVPETSDLPTIMIGVTEDKDRKTYIYEDSNSIENIEFSFKEESGKYYYKYKTKNSSYPAQNAWEEFKPVGSDINIKVYSNSRNSKTDSSGANISVTNTSNLKVRFEIEDDDTSNPRVYFKDPKSVVVTRK